MRAEHSPSVGAVQVMPISPGIAIGPVRLVKPTPHALPVTQHIEPEQVEAEQRRLHAALAAAIKELDELRARVEQTVGKNEAAIFEAQQLVLDDPELLDEVVALITRQHLSASAALFQASEHQARELEALENEMFAARAADVRDVVARAMRHLQGEIRPDRVMESAGMPALVVAYDLTPSDTATFHPDTVLGICTAAGGPTTHAAIIARAMEIPAVAGLDPHVLETLREGQLLAIDGAQGLLYLSLDTAQASALRGEMQHQRQERASRRSANEAVWRQRPASTADGAAIQVFANVGDIESARAAAEYGAEGIGLLRTEFLFGGRAVFPDEQEQFASYLALFRAFCDSTTSGKTIIARTLDAGADKPFPALEPLIGSLQEANPALGLRGARIHLVHEALLRQQLRALLRAGATAGVDLAIMFPMIATVEETLRLRAVYDSVKGELEREGVAVPPQTQVGIMVETPAAALLADALARNVDFFSIGANDLFQYTMAADRTNNRVTAMFGALEPAVWRLIDIVARAGNAHNKLVAVCGELAADPRIGPLLVGLGIKELSMSPAAMLNVKAALHAHPLAYWQQKAQELLQAETASDARRIVESIAIDAPR